jgi:hypothetical protein
MALSIAGAFGLFDKKVPKAPPPRDPYKEGAAMLGAQQRLLPDQFNYDAQAAGMYVPLYSQLYRDYILPFEEEQTERGVAADFDLVDRYSGRGRELLRGYNPEASAGMDAVLAHDREQFDSGMDLTPYEQRQIEQGLRSGYSARGLSLGGGDAAREALNAYAGGTARREQRRANLLQSSNASGQYYGNPFATVLGTQGGTRQSRAGGLAGQFFGATPQADPFSQYGQDLANTNFNAAYSERYNAQNQNAARAKMIADFEGSVLSAVGGAASSI